jgi:hypothetical protein
MKEIKNSWNCLNLSGTTDSTKSKHYIYECLNYIIIEIANSQMLHLNLLEKQKQENSKAVDEKINKH